MPRDFTSERAFALPAHPQRQTYRLNMPAPVRPPLKWNEWKPGQGFAISLLSVLDAGLLGFIVSRLVFG